MWHKTDHERNVNGLYDPTENPVALLDRLLSYTQLSEMLEKIDFLYSLDVHRYLDDLPDDLVRRYGRQMSRRPPWNRRKSRSRAERSSSPAL